MKILLLKISKATLLIASMALIVYGCGEDKKADQTNTNKEEVKAAPEAKAPAEEPVSETGIGPIQYVDIQPEINADLVAEGKAIFETKCVACHKFDERYVGPPLAGVTDRRNPAWIMNMILNPEEMTKKDPVAKQLLGEYLTQMVNQDVTEAETRALLEYLRTGGK